MKTFQTRLLHSLILVCLLTTLSLPVSRAQALGTIYVKWDAAGSNNGTSWANAYTDLQDALFASLSGDEIWVAAGTYKPTSGADRTVSFQIDGSVALYGGFVGNETSRDQRNQDPATNGTVLSGDIGTGGDNSDNSYHVVTNSGSSAAVLDGFTITGGNANGETEYMGGGMYNYYCFPTLTNVIFSGNMAYRGGGVHNHGSSPTLTNVTFSGNSADTDGGGMYNTWDSNPILTNVTFSGNSAFSGGGMYNSFEAYSGASSPTLTDVTFSGNTSNTGGGMENYGDPALTSVTFHGNSATYAGGGIYNWGNPTVTNATFSDNSASQGGGIYNYDFTSPILTNVTFRGNTVTDSGGGMFNGYSSAPKIRNTILWGNTAPTGAQIHNVGSTPVIRYSVVKGGCPAGSNCSSIITTNPLLGTLGDYRGSTQTIPLQAGSSAIDTGNDAWCPATDQRGVPRPYGSHCDIGAYEYAPAFHSIYYVKWNATGTNDGSSWTNAYIGLQSALAVAASGDQIWVAAGTYKPTTGTDQTATFQLESGVKIYGGFGGYEVKRDQRDPAVNSTILSGEIGAPGNADNIYHVVTGSGTNNTAILDGFTVTGGNADSTGGGMYNDNGSPTLTNMIFTGNTAYSGGGGMFNNSSNPTLTDVTFSGNSVDGEGGGMDNYNSSPTLTNVTFSGNVSNGYGGGLANGSSSPTLTNVTFSGNWAYWGGGMSNIASSPTLTNVTFNGNTAEENGGGMFNGGSSAPNIRNTILWGNSAPDGAQVFNGGGTPLIRDSVVQDGCPTGSTCSNLLTTDPLLGALDDYGGSTRTISLRAGSSAVNSGNDAYCPATDQRGVTRPKGLHCDIGAFEFWTSAPTLLSPFPAIILPNKRPIFNWTVVPDVTKYKLQVSRSNTFDVLDINVVVTSPVYFLDADLSTKKEYFWRVKAQAIGIWSPWSETWSFTTGKPPSIPVLASPADGALVRDYTPLLDWNDSTVPAGTILDYYHIMVASDPNFYSLVLNENIPGGPTVSFFTPSSDLPANDTYYWQVQAYNTDGHYSSWSTVWSFRTALEPPDIVFPTTGAVYINRRPTLDWSDVSDATGYKLVVSKYSDFSTPLLNVTVTASIFNNTDWTITLPAAKLIYWRVKALGDNPSAWTGGSFTTETSP